MPEETNNQPPLTYNVNEAAKLLDVNPYTIRRLVWRGLLPRVRGVRRVRIPRAAFQRFIDGGRKGDS